MYCTKCGKQLKDGSKFCTFCGMQVKMQSSSVQSAKNSVKQNQEAPVKKPDKLNSAPAGKNARQKSKKRGIAGLIIAACIAAVMLFAGGIILAVHFIFKGTNVSTSSEPTEYIRADHVEIFLEDSDFITGTEETANFLVVVGDNAEGNITVTDEKGTVISVLSNDGSGKLYGSFNVSEDAERFGTLTATSENGISGTAQFVVHPYVTDEMMDTLLAVGHDLAAYSSEKGYGDDDKLSKKEIQDLVKWLEQDARVSVVTSDESSVMYQTCDGLVGGCSILDEDDGCMGGTTDTEEDTSESAEESAESKVNSEKENITGNGRYTDYSENKEELSDTFESFMYGKEIPGDTVIKSELPVTNTKIIQLEGPDKDADVNYISPRILFPLDCISNVTIFESPEELTYSDSVSALLSGSYTDCGFLSICMHGYNSQGFASLDLGDFTDSEIEQLILNNGGTYSKIEDKVHVEEIDKWFDQYFWGNPKDTDYIRMYTWVSVKKSNIGTETHLFLTSYGLDSRLGTRLFDNTVIFNAVCYSSNINFDSNGKSLASAFVRHGASFVIGSDLQVKDDLAIDTMSQLAESWQVKDTMLYAAFSNVSATAPSGTDYSEYSATMTYKPAGGEKRVVSGETTIQGKVVDSAGKPVSDATVFAYQWLNHKFKVYATAVTDSAGRYSFENMEYTLYGFEAQIPSCFDGVSIRGWTTYVIEDIEDIHNVPDITLEWNNLEGKVVDKDTSEEISGAAVYIKTTLSGPGKTYTLAASNDPFEMECNAAAVTKEDGSFEINYIPPCEIEYYASKEEYSDSDLESFEISDTKTDYSLPENIELDPNNIPNQIDLLVSLYDTWKYAVQDGYYTSYYITDLDRDGYLEIHTETEKGTGLFTYARVWEVNEDITGLNEITTDGENYMPDAYTWFNKADGEPLTGWYDDASGISYYVTYDTLRDGYYETKCGYYMCWLDGTTLKWNLLGYISEKTSMMDTSKTTTKWVVNGTEVNSLDEFYDGCQDVFEGMKSFQYNIDYFDASDIDAVAPLRDLLVKSAEGFLLREIE